MKTKKLFPDNVAGELVQLNEAFGVAIKTSDQLVSEVLEQSEIARGTRADLKEIKGALDDIATSLRLLASGIRPEADCEPCLDMDHQKNYQ